MRLERGFCTLLVMIVRMAIVSTSTHLNDDKRTDSFPARDHHGISLKRHPPRLRSERVSESANLCGHRREFLGSE
jgi:hypothetical protein